MAMATNNLHPQPECLLIDGPFRIPSHLPQKPIAKGDTLSVSIAAASIVARAIYVREMKRYGVLPASFDASVDPIDVYAADQAYWRSFWHQPQNAP